jgi:hypothetical protein
VDLSHLEVQKHRNLEDNGAINGEAQANPLEFILPGSFHRFLFLLS